MKNKEKIISLDESQLKTAGKILGKALRDDPVFKYILPEKNERDDKIKYIFQLASCLGVKYGKVQATSSNLEGIAIWLPFEEYKKLTWGTFLCSIKFKIWKVGIKALKRFGPILDYSRKIHIKYASGEHWYLQTIGVKPSLQEMGFGSMLLNNMLKRIDQNPLPVFLETSLEKNVKYYRKFGFRVVEEGKAPGTEVKIWFMLRKKTKLI
jgi:ribosomal protein S18 acetylase RimI-like enzyme